jgi:hypothetical protein
MKKKKKKTTVPTCHSKLVERGNIDILNTQLFDCQCLWMTDSFYYWFIYLSGQFYWGDGGLWVDVYN